MGRAPSTDESKLKKGPWTAEEDQKLVEYIQKHGHSSWKALPKLAGLNRCGKSCRLRWTNYLRPDIKRGKFSPQEENTILQLHSVLGNKWSTIATHLPGRTDNEIKNYWNTHLKKKLLRMGIDPVTHQPRVDLLSAMPQLIALAGLKDIMGSQLAQFATIQSSPYRNLSTTNASNNHPFNPIDLWSNSDSTLSKLPLPGYFPFADAGNAQQPNQDKSCENLSSSVDIVSAQSIPHNLMDTSASNGDTYSSLNYEKSVVSSVWPDSFSEANFLSDYASL